MKENEIRPKELFERYLELSLKDAALINKDKLVSINCPACSSTNLIEIFSKNSFKFDKCQECHSVFCNPRPTLAELENFYQNSESSNFWSNEFFPKVAEARREKMFRPRAEKIFSLLKNEQFNPETICDVGAGYGILIEELRDLFPDKKYFAVEPGDELSKVCRSKNIETLQKTCETAEAWHDKFDLVVCSEVIEHVFSPLDFVVSLKKLVRKGGYCLITGLGYEGFDILSLQEKSQSVFPPHHINFLSVAGFELLFKRAGFRSISVSTPGKLDVDIVLNSGLANEFLQALSRRGPKFLEKFQALLAEAKLSSHVWVFAKA